MFIMQCNYVNFVAYKYEFIFAIYENSSDFQIEMGSKSKCLMVAEKGQSKNVMLSIGTPQNS